MGAVFLWECAVFVAFVFGSAAVPLWLARKRQAPQTKRDYVFAGVGAQVSLLAMVLSVARGTLGVRSFLGFPSELVYRGSGMWETLYGMTLALPLVCVLFVPVYYPLGATSVYQYLEMRFRSAAVRRLAAATFLLRQILNLAVTVYTPAVALHAAFGLPPLVTVAALTALAITLTLLGGLGAAIKADAVQTGTMVVVSLVLITAGTVAAGGPAPVLRANQQGGRLRFFEFTWDMRTRVDTLSALLGQLFMSLSVYGCQQTFVQRYSSMRSQRRVARTLALCAPAVAALFTLSWLVGMVVYAAYADCDPYASGRIARPDEVLPLFVGERMAVLPGALGLFLGSLFNGSLSFLVSNVNSLATVTWEDFVSATPPFRGAADAQQLLVIKIIGVLYALAIASLSMGVALVAGVVEASLLVTSATAGPLLGVFLLAVLLPCVDSVGALAGMVSALTLTAWLALGRLLKIRADLTPLPLRTDGCDNTTNIHFTETAAMSAELNHTLHMLLPAGEASTSLPQTRPWPLELYAVSYMWYGVLGTGVCVAVGLAVSACRPRFVPEPRLLHPLVRRLTAAPSVSQPIPSIPQSAPDPPRPLPATMQSYDKISNSTTVTVATGVLVDSRHFDTYSLPSVEHQSFPRLVTKL